MLYLDPLSSTALLLNAWFVFLRGRFPPLSSGCNDLRESYEGSLELILIWRCFRLFVYDTVDENRSITVSYCVGKGWNTFDISSAMKSNYSIFIHRARVADDLGNARVSIFHHAEALEYSYLQCFFLDDRWMCSPYSSWNLKIQLDEIKILDCFVCSIFLEESSSTRSICALINKMLKHILLLQV